MRRALIHSQPAVKVRSMSKMAGEAHLHSCAARDCRLVYEDSCNTPGENGRCHVCRNVRRPVWAEGRDPRDCCWGNCEQVTDKVQIRRYALAGPGPWYQCRTCARTHGWPCA
jgi:hypothetical protein